MTSERVLFSGLDSTHDLPSAYRRLQRRHGAITDELTFYGALNRVEEKYNIEWRDLLHLTGDAVVEDGDFMPFDGFDHLSPVDHYRALVNPAWEGRDAADIPGDRNDAVWHIPTKKYTKVAHHDAWLPLYDALGLHGKGDDVFGTVRTRREGGEVHMDLFFSDVGITTSDGNDITFGLSTGHDYYGNVRLYVDVIAYHNTGDGVGQVMRYLTEPTRRKHTGSADEEIEAWFTNAVDRLETVTDRMYTLVHEAMEHEIPLKDMPCTVEGFYEHLGLPNRGGSELATPAGERAVKMAVGPYTAWHMYKAGMWAVEHHYESRDTSSFKSHVQTVNTLLFNPGLAEKQVLSSIEDDLKEAKTDDDHDIWGSLGEETPDDALSTVRGRAKSISEGVEEVEDTRERIRKLLTDEGVVEADPDESDATDMEADD